MSALMLRMGFALPAYVIILTLSKSPSRHVKKTDLLYLFLLGFLGYYLASFLDFKGLTFIKASLERLILFIYPTLVLLLSFILFRKKIIRMQKIGVAITYLGIVIVFIPELTLSSSQLNSDVIKGAILVFFSALSYAMYLVGSQWLIPKFGVRRFTAMAMIWSGTLVLIHYLVTAEAPLSIFEWTPRVYLIGGLMGIVSTILPSFLISYAIHKLGAAQFSILAALGPISTISLAYIFLSERINLVQVLGSLVVICGVLMAEYYGKKAKV